MKQLFFYLCLFSSSLWAKEQEPISLVKPLTPIQLQPDTSIIALGDYFLGDERVVEVRIFPEREAANTALKQLERETYQLITTDKTPLLSVLRVQTNKGKYDFILKKSQKIRHRFVFEPNDESYEKVQLAGNFNNWSPNGSEFQLNSAGKWEKEVLIDPGLHQYQFVVDGNWILDPANKDSVDNNIGGFNSSLQIGLKDPSKNPPYWYTHKAEKGAIHLRKRGGTQQAFILWNNQLLPPRHVDADKETMIVRLPKAAQKTPYSYLQVYAYNANGIGHDLLIPLHYDQAITDPAQLTEWHLHQTIIYFILVDRFANGDTSNDVPVGDKEVHKKANFQGGDLAGITQQLEDNYFNKLGVNTLWISPILRNPDTAFVEWPKPHRKYSGYHGYWPVSWTEVDPHFGSNKDLEILVDLAHTKDKKILLDFVANHVHENHPVYQQHPEWGTQLDLPNGQKNIRIWDEQRLTTWFDTFLPTLDLERPEVTEIVADTALYWLKNFKLDGFRHDATKHIPNQFWKSLTRKVNEEVVQGQNRPVLQIGETFGSRELIASYIDNTQLDGQFDFNLYFDARSVFVNDQESFVKLQNSLEESISFYGAHSLMGNISGNHDMPRFISFASGTLQFDEDAREVGWNREVGANRIGHQKLASLNAFNLTIPGIPVIYYGDEIGIPGANDPDNRRLMYFDNWSPLEQFTYEVTSDLCHLRQNSMALLYGQTDFLQADDNSFAYIRHYFGEQVIVVFNKSPETKLFELELPQYCLGKTFKAIDKATTSYKVGDDRKIKVPVYGNMVNVLIASD